jgi:tRNA U34 5-methylaminomethyl-2-thiouridine-forming methyltransferase MnmC
MGFGTGLNTVLSIQHKPANQTIHYTALEIFPLPLTLIESIGFTKWMKPQLWTDIHQCKWNVRIPISSQFTLYKCTESIHDHSPRHHYDLIYYDAFAPSYQPELWTFSQFKKIKEWIRPNGGYCYLLWQKEVSNAI